MSIITALHHITHYQYSKPITLGPQLIRLRPAPHTRTRIQSYTLNITPHEHFINWQQDPFGNYMAKLVFQERTQEFKVEVDLLAEIKAFNPLDFFLDDDYQKFPFNYDHQLAESLKPYLEISEHSGLLQNFYRDINTAKQPVIDFLASLNQNLFDTINYTIRLEPGVQSCEETLAKKSGSCRDMAWLFCQTLRHLGLASRFVSGYLIQLKPNKKNLEGPDGPPHDLTDLHAWTEVYLPGAGWVGLDPTSGLFTNEGHIPLCCTPSPQSAAPISGSHQVCESTMTHDMSVERLHQDHDVEKPYTTYQWKNIDKLGEQIDLDLKKNNVQLTQGGEPTFVSSKDRESDEWQCDALGQQKKVLSLELLHRLKTQFSPKGLTLHSQGKWYPGETLPRWAMHSYWRKDHEPLWLRPELLLDPESSGKYTLNTAKILLDHLACALGIPSSYVLLAKEDPLEVLRKNKQKPMKKQQTITPNLSQKKSLEELTTSAELNAGYVLPLNYSPRLRRWISNPWQFSHGREVILITGDSPIGMRLPLASLPTLKASKQEVWPEQSLFLQKNPLPSRKSLHNTLKTRKANIDSLQPYAHDPSGLIKSALCVEIRNGIIRLFLPPTTYAEHFIDLIYALETVVTDLDTPIVIEGYTPPRDLRFNHFSITPDPGVIEVNIQPSKTWKELKDVTSILYNEAHQIHLTADKFLLDGRRVGTGGGNHIVAGATTPEQSPFLRRPDLLRSMIAFWQNHPSLSYLFSSMYVGPTSQAPRIDEARHDSLHELEIAFQQIKPYQETSPWFVDRLFRNLLVDVTGNTHRAEFCIDKLFSPDHEMGRLGLLELRGFEMTPHPQMNLLQALLVRACIAHFWQNPYQNKLVNWGTHLHDRYMLPHVIWQDFQDVLAELRLSGYDFQKNWFKPFLDFRFPKYGQTQIGDIDLELRMALEPWPVMGEEMQKGAVSRAVDSSLERLQVKITGISQEHHHVLCNGHKVPLQATEEKDTFIAGVRYKAWQLHKGLHPNLPIDAPLTFDVIDVHHQRSLGGCTYHVIHPGGRNYETMPVNNNEAQGRQLARFQNIGHTPGRCCTSSTLVSEYFPYTLDLRAQPMNPVKHKNRILEKELEENL